MPQGVHRALIVDDERLARRELATLLQSCRNVEVAGEADSVRTATLAAERLHPEIIFLDIQMPGESGFDLLPSLPADTAVVFVTAHDEYAVRAFEVNALDYLLKPVHPDRLAATLERILARPAPERQSDRKLAYDDRLFVTVGSRPQFVRVDGIAAVEAAGDYTELILRDGTKALMSSPIRAWEQRLPEKHFMRIHRSTIINLEYIERVEAWSDHAYRVHMKEVRRVYAVSRRYAARLRAELR